jgi:hypothetical protein
MPHVSTTAGLHLDLPHVAVPKFRPPHLSQRARALLMIALMVSPAFLADDIGYCVQRLFMSADQIAAQQVPDGTMPTNLYVFHVACSDTDAPGARQQRWAEFAANHGWPRYPQAGPGCFKPDRALYGIVGLKAFNVACPTMVLSVADQRRWVAFAQNHGWTDYARAGVGCVDP